MLTRRDFLSISFFGSLSLGFSKGPVAEMFDIFRWTAYSPTHYSPGKSIIISSAQQAYKRGTLSKNSLDEYVKNVERTSEKVQYPSHVSLQADMQTMLEAGIEGVVTYGANNGLKDIPNLVFSGLLRDLDGGCGAALGICLR